jgi:hypothetical protein
MWSEKHDVAAYLIDHGSDLKFAPLLNNQTTSIAWAGFSQTGDSTIAKKLVAKGLDVNTRNAHEESALFYALKTGEDTDLIRYLRSVGAKEPEDFKRNKTIPSRAVPPVGPGRTDLIRKSAQRAIDLMQHSSKISLQRRDACSSCHHQLLPCTNGRDQPVSANVVEYSGTEAVPPSRRGSERGRIALEQERSRRSCEQTRLAFAGFTIGVQAPAACR